MPIVLETGSGVSPLVYRFAVTILRFGTSQTERVLDFDGQRAPLL